MIIIRLIYIAVLVLCAVFCVLYRDALAIMLFSSLLILPLITFACAAISRARTKVSAKVLGDVQSIGDNAKLQIKINNRCPFPLFAVAVKIYITNSFNSTSSVCTSRFSSSAFSDEVHEFAIKSNHCGRLDISVDKIYFYDALRLFKFSKKLDCRKTVTVLPKIHELSVDVVNHGIYAGETDIFSKTRPGDDPSEVFDIRDYKGGDKLNRIHWKLSVKQNHYMVKQYSFPINEMILIYVDLFIDRKNKSALELLDSEIAILLSMAFKFVNLQKQFKICWYNDESKQLIFEDIKSVEDIYSALSGLYSTKLLSNRFDPLISNDLSKQLLSHMCFITTENGENIQKSISAFGNPNVRYNAFITALEQDKTEITLPNFKIYSVDPDSVDEGVSNITL